jgi:hypothetical protein
MVKAKNYRMLEAVSSCPSPMVCTMAFISKRVTQILRKSDYSVSVCNLYAIVSFRSQVFYDNFTNITVFNILYI